MMQFRIFQIPISGDAEAEESMNHFLRSHRVVSVTKELVSSPNSGAWCFCVEYLPGEAEPGGKRPYGQKTDRVDYKEVLSDADFALYAKLRDVRKAAAEREAVPVYAVCTNQQMSLMAKQRPKSLSELKEIPGLGEAKAAKFGADFLGVIKLWEDPEKTAENQGCLSCAEPET